MSKDKYVLSINSKNEFRKHCIKKLKQNDTLFTKIKKDNIIRNKIYQLIKLYKIKNILIYLPFGFEVNITPLIRKLRMEKYQLFAPIVVGDDLIISKYRLPLKKNKFKILEPNKSIVNIKNKIDFAIVPIVGFDPTNRRVGFGFGFYDKFYSTLQHKPKTVFVQRCRCKSKKILTNRYDVKADFIITNKC